MISNEINKCRGNCEPTNSVVSEDALFQYLVETVKPRLAVDTDVLEVLAVNDREKALSVLGWSKRDYVLDAFSDIVHGDRINIPSAIGLTATYKDRLESTVISAALDELFPAK